MMRWEYCIWARVGWLGGVPSAEVLNQVGEEGWELFHVDEKFLWFKRPKEDKLG